MLTQVITYDKTFVVFHIRKLPTIKLVILPERCYCMHLSVFEIDTVCYNSIGGLLCVISVSPNILSAVIHNRVILNIKFTILVMLIRCTNLL